MAICAEHVLIRSNGQPVLIDLGSTYRISEGSRILSGDQTGSCLSESGKHSGCVIDGGSGGSRFGCERLLRPWCDRFSAVERPITISDESPEAVLQAHLQDSVPKLPTIYNRCSLSSTV